MSSFSSRYGLRGDAQEITVREDAPEDLRYALLAIARALNMQPSTMREVVCEVLLKRPDYENNWSDYPNVWNEVNNLIQDCAWFRVYDIAEALHKHFSLHQADAATKFEDRLNQYFLEHGIGWKLERGEIGYRGSEAFTDTTAGAVEALAEAGQTRAASEIHEALRDISRRPKPDVTGAVQHVMAAFECAAREVTGDRKATLGQLAAKLDLPTPLRIAVEKLWGYSSERARHVREGESISTDEAELVVSVSCAVCTFLSRRATPG